jgi:hypothetical protein
MTTLAEPAVTSAEPMRERAPTLDVARRAARRATRSEYRWLIGLAMLLFLVVALAARILPRSLRVRLLHLPARGSVLHDARVMAAMSIPFVFMG